MGDGDNTPGKQGLSTPWQPGVSANPAGRPKGSRNKLGEDFIRALHDDFQEHGAGTIARVREEKPAEYMKVVAGLLPKEIKLTDERDLSDAELADRIRQIAAALDLTISGDLGDGEAAHRAEAPKGYQ